MSAPVRFLAIVVLGWAGVRTVTLGAVPGFTVSYAKEMPADTLPPLVATEFPPLPPVDPGATPPWASQLYAANYSPAPNIAPRNYYLPYPYVIRSSPAPEPIPPRPEWHLPGSGASTFGLQPGDEWQVSGLAAFPQRRSSPSQSVPVQVALQPRLDRLQLSSWAMLRGSPNSDSLATGGTLGGSQAGARLTYAFNRWLAASLRTTSPIGGSSGAEVAGGVRFTPFRSIPVAITAERRQSISRSGNGRSAFALFAEGGLYRHPMPWKFNLDAYVQAGIVGLDGRDLFADGALAFTRPVWGRFSAGIGVWGGIQPGLYRVDAGPRVSFRIRDNLYAHLDWRQRLAGSAEPASGPAVTLAADF